MAQFDISGFFDRFDIARALFDPEGEETSTLEFSIFGKTLQLGYINSVTRHSDRGSEWMIVGIVGMFGSDFFGSQQATLYYSTRSNEGTLVIDVGDPRSVDECIEPVASVCLRCPTCGAPSRMTGKKFKDAHIRECTMCLDVCDYDPEHTWFHRFTVPNLENRPNRNVDLQIEYNPAWFDALYNDT